MGHLYLTAGQSAEQYAELVAQLAELSGPPGGEGPPGDEGPPGPPGYSHWSCISKPVDEVITSNATLQDDDHFQFEMAALTRYRIRGLVWYVTPAAADWRYGFVVPLLPTFVRAILREGVPGGNFSNPSPVDVLPVNDTIVGGGAVGGALQFWFLFQTGSLGGLFKLRWAQATTNIGATYVCAGSYIEYYAAAA